GTAAEQLTIRSASNWINLEGSSSTGSVHPYELMNIDKVHSFTDGTNNLTGVGQVIHIADFNCDDSHEIYNNKTIYNLDNGGVGESTFGAATSSDSHCQFVANMAAGDSNADVVGVAPDADLVLSSIPNTEGTFDTDDFASDLDSARGYGAVASNNSWAISDNTDDNPNANFNKTEAQAFYDANIGTFTKDQIFGFRAEGVHSTAGTGMDEQTLAWKSYITALDNFQNTGVVVFANGNYSGESDASFMAALPEFYSQLSEAWLSVNYSDFSGSSLEGAVEGDFTLKGNKCGSAKEYCVTVDDRLLKGGSYVSGGVSQYGDNGSGSSYGAPMVSGGIALLAQAFPNHTPEQITDRLLASANNSWFTAEGSTTFTTHGNSITHGYHSNWGQGVPDFYAALSPITTNANPAMALYMGGSIQEGVSSDSSLSLASSSITPSASFGDSIYQGLSGEVGYAYDALSGGFKYDMTSRIDMSNNDTPTISLASEMAKLDSLLAVNNPSWKNNFSQVLSQLSKTDKLETNLTVGASSLPVQSFFGSNFDSSISLNDYETPYLESGEGGLGLGATYQLGDSRLLVGMTNPINQSSDSVIGLRKSLIASLEYGNPADSAITFMAGVTQDKDSLLGSTGDSAYSLSGSKSNTTFTAFKAQTQLGQDLSLTGIATLANTNMTRPDNSFINSASNVKSTSVSLIANKGNVFGD
ncbi:MAG: S8 family serine peptidase, partial [Candidatus Marinimicrobia bacterium]|nr:S8 family serine peptidase [Candidatus Neomarinimicrobiota bacterium]